MASQHANAGMPEEFSEVLKIGVLGAGAFGTSMATVAGRRGHRVILWARDAAQVQTMKETRRNPKYGMDEFELPENILPTNSLEEACQGADILILALPAQRVPEFCRQHVSLIEEKTVLCNTAKGLYVPTEQLLSDAVLEAMDRPDQPYAVLSGPSFAVEIMQGMPTAVVVASKLLYHAVKVQRAMSSLTFRIYSSQDLVGVQLGGALKNPLAVGAGMIEGAGFGINTLAAYVTRSSNELRSLCIAMGGHPDTITGLSGVGDLMLTAFGSLSRNRTLGKRLMEGEKLDDLLKEKTVEGVPTAKVAVAYAKQCGLDTPFFEAIHKLLSGEVNPAEAQMLLMNRPLKSEH
jgi:glycerol-3-phosphate dehydrogenase (NAD+)